jgi:hypothetical protein
MQKRGCNGAIPQFAESILSGVVAIGDVWDPESVEKRGVTRDFQSSLGHLNTP